MKKNNKGFTLIELLAVLVILGIILSISIVAVGRIMRNQKGKNERNALTSIFTAAKLYCAKYPNNTECTSPSTGITISQLKNENMLELDDKLTVFDDNDRVKFEICSDNLHRKYKLYDSSGNEKQITYSDGQSKNYNDCGCVDQTEKLFNTSDVAIIESGYNLCTN